MHSVLRLGVLFLLCCPFGFKCAFCRRYGASFSNNIQISGYLKLDVAPFPMAKKAALKHLAWDIRIL